MDIFVILNDHVAPERLNERRSEGLLENSIDEGLSYHCRVSLPTSNTLIVYGRSALWDQIPEQLMFTVRLILDSTVPEKLIASFDKTSKMAYIDLKWTENEQELVTKMIEEDRLARLIVAVQHKAPLSPDPSPKVTDSQASNFSPLSDYVTPRSKVDNDQKDSLQRKSRSDELASTKPAQQRVVKRRANDAATPAADDLQTPTAKRIAFTDTESPASQTDLISFKGAPSGRWGHSLTKVDEDTFLVYGGQGAKSEMVKDTLWMLVYKDGAAKWGSIDAKGAVPTNRMGHSMVFCEEDRKLFMFGGSRTMRWYNDIYSFDLASLTWDCVKANGKAPTSTYHSATMFRDEMIVFGGVHGHQSIKIPDVCNNELYIFNPKLLTWYQPLISGNLPCPRSGHSATLVDDNHLVIFGGWDSPTCFNDLFILDLSLMEFSQPIVKGQPPCPRTWHSATLLPNNRILIFGGFDGSDAMCDAHVFDVDKLEWSLYAEDLVNLPFAGHTTFMASPQRLAIFGGGDNEDHYYNNIVLKDL